jgi:hypothetical protein
VSVSARFVAGKKGDQPRAGGSFGQNTVSPAAPDIAKAADQQHSHDHLNENQ